MTEQQRPYVIHDAFRVCVHCNAPHGHVDACCAACESDPHAHCPSWPSCTRADYGRSCEASRKGSLHLSTESFLASLEDEKKDH